MRSTVLLIASHASLDSALIMSQNCEVLQDPKLSTRDSHSASTVSGIVLPLPQHLAHVALAAAS